MIISLSLTSVSKQYTILCMTINGLNTTLNLRTPNLEEFIDRINPVEIRNEVGDTISRERLTEIIEDAE